MITYKEVLKPIQEVNEVICDKCKKPITGSKLENREYLHIKHEGGYFSDYPGDLSILECVLCEDCIKVIFDDFATITRSNDVF